jgi:1-aminocyclopropane-1-carboxylate deaminase
MKIETQEIFNSLYRDADVRVFIKRLDLIKSDISGNKYFKLKYNILEAISKGYKKVLTFGGAFSNHILATAVISNKYKLLSTGIIRGDEHSILNTTLQIASDNGMKFKYISREEYKSKDSQDFIDNINIKYQDYYIIPEGGTNDLAIKGTEEIIDVNDTHDYVCCAVGTGGTISGIINSSQNHQMILGFPAIKGNNSLKEKITLMTNKNNWKLIDKYHFGGYARFNNELIDFINSFYINHNIPLDLIYTSKMIFGLHDLINLRKIPKGSNILLIHTGGLQGNIGMNSIHNLNLHVK